MQTKNASGFGVLPNDIGSMERGFERGAQSIAGKISGTIRREKVQEGYGVEKLADRMIQGEKAPFGTNEKQAIRLELRDNYEKEFQKQVDETLKIEGQDYEPTVKGELVNFATKAVENDFPTELLVGKYGAPYEEVMNSNSSSNDAKQIAADKFNQVQRWTNKVNADEKNRLVSDAKNGAIRYDSKTRQIVRNGDDGRKTIAIVDSGKGKGKGVVSNKATAIGQGGGGECCIFNEYGGGCAPWNR